MLAAQQRIGMAMRPRRGGHGLQQCDPLIAARVEDREERSCHPPRERRIVEDHGRRLPGAHRGHGDFGAIEVDQRISKVLLKFLEGGLRRFAGLSHQRIKRAFKVFSNPTHLPSC